jgi:alpha 1,2-mannosyltransferase
MKEIIYGASESYRHMCRFQSGWFYRQEALQKYDYYWRVEPGIKMFCEVEDDVFTFMRENKKKYGFTISILEYSETIPTLWNAVKEFMAQYSWLLAKSNALDFISYDSGESYNMCHFWSNFEIGDLNFFRGEAYQTFFDHLDRSGGFFYERWGDAPVHSIAASLLLNATEVHFFDQIGYYHVPFTHCPTDQSSYAHKCSCDPQENIDWMGYSCLQRWFSVADLRLPDGWEAQQQ